MAVHIRLARHGRHNLPYYRIVATHHENPRDGRYLEVLGKLNTLTDPPTMTVKEERVKYWISVGAIPSHTLKQILKKTIPGYYDNIETKRLEKVKATRKKRKARLKAAGKTAPKTAKPKKVAMKAKAKAKAKAAAPAA